jgi:hypothetical protein
MQQGFRQLRARGRRQLLDNHLAPLQARDILRSQKAIPCRMICPALTVKPRLHFANV